MTSSDAATTPAVALDHDDARAGTGFIAVGFDGSSSALLALRRGIVLAEALKVRLVTVTSWTYPVSYGGMIYTGGSPEDDAEDIASGARLVMFPQGAPAWFSNRIVEGRSAEVLIAETEHADMLVVGSRGHGGFAGLLLGSVSAACAEHAHCPVLVMHERETINAVAPSATRGTVAALAS